MSVIENVINCCDSLGEIDLSGIRLEDALPSLLDVSEMTLDEHVAMQPSAIAYYGSLLKSANRRLSECKRAFERWEKIAISEARASFTTKVTIDEVRARFLVDNEASLNDWYTKQDNLQAEYDALYVWNEAWKQKAHSIREYVKLTEDERWNSSSHTKEGRPGGSGEHNRSSLSDVKARLRKIKQEKL